VESTNYPEAVNLAFNFSSVKADFELRTPGSDMPTEEGSWVIIQGNNAILEETDSGPRLLHGTLPGWLIPQQPVLCIGTWRGRPLRALSISSSLDLLSPLVSEPFNSTSDRIDIQTLTLAGLGKLVLHWEKQSRHCSRCGARTADITGSWGRRCTACNVEHYPHIHPCAIVLVKRGNELLLTRKAEWPAGRYSLVAGFLDIGESLEECAVREVKEETGIDICNVRYVGSQNWPFPAQLMAGFVADYASGEIRVEKSELEDARWFTPDDLPGLPTRRSIARWIIDNFK
jgi:NAD+ diphosphatase